MYLQIDRIYGSFMNHYVGSPDRAGKKETLPDSWNWSAKLPPPDNCLVETNTGRFEDHNRC